MWVVKIGGSLAFSDQLRMWLEALARDGKGKAVIVPGGGPFADQVRAAQQHWSFPDEDAHAMALLAMEQYGWMMCGLCHDLQPAHSLQDVVQTVGRARVPVWHPANLVRERRELPASWSLTSDSLAAWIAARLGATGLLLVKSLDPGRSARDCDDLRHEDVVDPLFCEFVASARFETRVCGPGDHTQFSELLYGAGGCGARVTAGTSMEPARSSG